MDKNKFDIEIDGKEFIIKNISVSNINKASASVSLNAFLRCETHP